MMSLVMALCDLRRSFQLQEINPWSVSREVHYHTYRCISLTRLIMAIKSRVSYFTVVFKLKDYSRSLVVT